jgi:oligoendopeptidase F
MALATRAEIDKELTWNLDDIFPDENTYERALADVCDTAKAFAGKYKNNIGTLDTAGLESALSAYADLIGRMQQVGVYASLAMAADYTDQAAKRRMLVMRQALTPIQAELSFFQSELLELETERLQPFENGSFGAFVANLLREKPHRFSPETERVLAAMSSLRDLPSELYEAAKLGDLTFPDFTVGDTVYPLSYSLYETVYAETPDTDVRHRAHDIFYDTIASQRQAIGLAYFTEVAAQKTLADLRGYDSVFDMLLSDQQVTRDLYERQIDVLMRDLAPVMRRYAAKLKANYGLETLTYADLRLPALPAKDRAVSIAEAWSLAMAALDVMGPDYQSVVTRAKDERWVDFAQNIGKSTGGFCASVPAVHPYILLNWNGGFSEVFTLVHELGHAAQTLISAEHNNILQEDPSLYFVEAPSTIHELLLTNHLLAAGDDPETARTVAAQMVGKTYFHNCVTHLLEAAFQRDVYRAVEAGEGLSADDFDRLFLNILRRFWGDAVSLPESSGRTWMRQPHYYMGLYPYTYSAGMVVSTQVSKNIREQGEPAVKAWIDTLKLGGSRSPVELARAAGVDLLSEAPLHTMVQVIGELVDLI